MSGVTQEKQSHLSNVSTELAISFGHHSQQGVRPTMEYAVVLNDNFVVKNSKCTSHKLALFAVFDGHGGGMCATYCADNLSKFLSKHLELCNNVHEAIGQAIQELDDHALKNATDGSGSTCTISLIDKCNYDVWVANIGDSRCILVSQTNVVQLSVEHKPDHPNEKTRIEQADGWVRLGRVMGILAVSRSLGDKGFKKNDDTDNLVVSTPSIKHYKIKENKLHVILACDGLFDVFENDEVQSYVNQLKNSNPNLSLDEIAKKLVHDAIHVRNSKDNVTTIVVEINANPTNVIESINNDDRLSSHVSSERNVDSSTSHHVSEFDTNMQGTFK